MESLKTKSRIVTIIVTIIFAALTYIATMNPEVLATYLPDGFEGYAAVIIVLAAAIVNQYSEEKRVERAEELAVEHSTTIMGTPVDDGVMLNDEYISPNDSETDADAENVDVIDSEDGC
ncbi:hypothetical protein [Methanobrevibacter olleyae]|uniref:Holin n=1 Tax=Methanobrevibacter olleyae TaxID=294671 RepID=A0A126R2Q9_METOL|nr:hypothetical protein [Methanobrevibacter olleyae]AMK16338.1 hypothetical protein YLM1_1783 [Methanobrevibacter olleyae]